MNSGYYFETRIGRIGVAENGKAITQLRLPCEEIIGDYEVQQTQLISETALQLEAYFAGGLKEFSLPLDPAGTDFMKSVWQALKTIPYAETRSYKQIAEMAGSPRACRAVGMANNRNPISIIVPCHRVIGADGSLVGYGGGLELKRYLLHLEQQNV